MKARERGRDGGGGGEQAVLPKHPRCVLLLGTPDRMDTERPWL